MLWKAGNWKCFRKQTNRGTLPRTCTLRHEVKIIPHCTHPDPKPRPPTPNEPLPTTHPIIEIRLSQDSRELKGADPEASVERYSNHASK